MQTVIMHQAKTHLSRPVDGAVKGAPFFTAKAGKPLVKVIAIEDKKASGKRKLGVLAGKYKVPDDIKAFARGRASGPHGATRPWQSMETG